MEDFMKTNYIALLVLMVFIMPSFAMEKDEAIDSMQESETQEVGATIVSTSESYQGQNYNNELIYDCGYEGCNRVFRSHQGLLRHFRLVHFKAATILGNKLIYRCRICCKRRYQYQAELKEHFDRKHPGLRVFQ